MCSLDMEQNMIIFSNLNRGIDYMKKWPLEPLLNPVFKENRVKRALLLGNKILPPFIVFIFFWGFYLGGGFKGVPFLFAIGSNFPVTIACVLFLLLMPVQGYYWFYKRSVTSLNEKQKAFYKDTCKKLEIEPSINPTMYDLEIVINKGINKLGREFLKQL